MTNSTLYACCFNNEIHHSWNRHRELCQHATSSAASIATSKAPAGLEVYAEARQEPSICLRESFFLAATTPHAAMSTPNSYAQAVKIFVLALMVRRRPTRRRREVKSSL